MFFQKQLSLLSWFPGEFAKVFAVLIILEASEYCCPNCVPFSLDYSSFAGPISMLKGPASKKMPPGFMSSTVVAPGVADNISEGKYISWMYHDLNISMQKVNIFALNLLLCFHKWLHKWWKELKRLLGFLLLDLDNWCKIYVGLYLERRNRVFLGNIGFAS